MLLVCYGKSIFLLTFKSFIICIIFFQNKKQCVKFVLKSAKMLRFTFQELSVLIGLIYRLCYQTSNKFTSQYVFEKVTIVYAIKACNLIRNTYIQGSCFFRFLEIQCQTRSTITVVPSGDERCNVVPAA